MLLHPFFDAVSCTFSYVLVEPGSGACAIIDPVLGYDADRGEIRSEGAEHIVEFVQTNHLRPEWILETHVHADHLSAARYLKSRFPGVQIGMGQGVCQVQQHLAPYLNQAIAVDGSQFDRLFADGDRVKLGHISGRVLTTPGHTPACVTYVFDDMAFVGDTLFMPDFGSARCDFPGGDAGVLYDSVQALFALPPQTRLLMCHDYAPGERDYHYATSVMAEQRDNVHLREGIGRDDFESLRRGRDVTLELPKMMSLAVPFNLVGGLADVGALRCRRQGLAA